MPDPAELSRSLANLFPEGDYHFHMGFERGRAEEFFAPTAEHDTLIVQRRRWLRTAPNTYAAILPEGAALLDEAVELAGKWQGFTLGYTKVGNWEQCLALGEFLEPDYLLLKGDADGAIRLYGGCVCFPSSWRLSDKIGRPIEIIHDPVPGLNASIGSAIHKFLSAVKPGVAWLRHNWGLARDAELNRHPDRDLPKLDSHVAVEEVFLRVEHQALVALPESGGLLFGIRVANHRLVDVKADPVARVRLHRALETMAEAIAVYKGIASTRGRILEMLAG